MIKFISLGGANEIGANSYYLNLDGRGILLDAGQHPRKKDNKMFPNINYIKDKNVDSIIISHAHIDHIGALPFYLKLFPYLRPFMTVPTAYLTQIMLRNSYNILKAEYNIDPAFYDTTLADMIFNVTKPYPYHQEFELIPFQYPSENKITCKFYEAGHIIGSACTLIKFGNKNILYTGDISKKDQSLIPGINLPKEKINILIIETTTAGDENKKPNRNIIIDDFISSISKIISSGGSVLIPVFALGKSQEILYIIHKAIKNNLIQNINIFTGELHNKISSIYDIFNFNIPRIEKGFEFKEINQNKINRNINENEFLYTPGIVLAPGGMMDKNTLSYELLLRMIENINHGIFFVGYTDPESPGYLIKNSANKDVINSDLFPKQLKINSSIKSFGFSSHASLEDLINIILELNPEIVIPVHGSIEGQKRLKEYLIDRDYKGEYIIPSDGLEIILD